MPSVYNEAQMPKTSSSTFALSKAKGGKQDEGEVWDRWIHVCDLFLVSFW